MDWYYDQMESTIPLTQEMIDKAEQKCYDSGRPYQAGDIVLFGMRKNGEDDYTMVTFHLDEINIVYTVKENLKGSRIFPILIPIT